MALNSEAEDVDTEVVDEELQPDTQDTETEDTTSEVEGEEAEPGSETEETDEVVITIGEPPGDTPDDPPQPETEAIRNLRKAHRDQTARIRELERQVKAGGSKATEVELGAKPKMSDPDVNFDEDVFEQRLDEWKLRKQAHDDRQRQAQDAQKKADETWQERQQAYGTQKSVLKVKDFEDAEGNAFELLSEVQRAVILHGAENAAHVVYALGKNPAELKRIAAITEPVKFAFAIGKLETQLKVTPRKSPPVPERVVRGSAQPGSEDRKLEQLRTQAAKSGDSTQLIRYKRQLAERKKA